VNSRLYPVNARRQAGFGLLEVLVSLVIFASVGFTLLAWFQQSLDTVQRLRSFYQLQDARKTALEVARSINPALKARGETPLGAMKLTWVAEPEGEERVQAGYPAGIGRYRLQLYSTTLSVFRSGDVNPWFTEKLTLIGYRLDGAPSTGFASGL
jgi:general secretion pathway protein I